MSGTVSPALRTAEGRRWVALTALCLGVLLVAMNSTLATVALPSIRERLSFSDSSLTWVVNAYLTVFGGSLLLGGRLGDIFGCRRLLLLGILIFTLASLACGLAGTPTQLITARSAQGLGAAIMYAVTFAQISILFADAQERARALGTYVFVSACGGSVGTLLGGVLVNAFDWHWVFLANVPIGVAVFMLCTTVLPDNRREPAHVRLDIAGAATATASLMLAISAIVNSSKAGFASARTLALLGSAAALFILFIALDRRAEAPLVPLELFRNKGLAVASGAAAFFSAALLAGNFTAALYMQIVLLLNPLQLGLAFLPATLGAALMSLLAAPALVARLGARRTLILGLLITAAGLILLANAPAAARVALDVLPGMLLIGIGAGTAYNPLFLSALGSVAPSEAGAASGIVNTSYMMGGALGLSVVSSVAAAKASHLLSSGSHLTAALNGGYQVGFATGAAFALCAALIGLRTSCHEDRSSARTGR